MDVCNWDTGGTGGTDGWMEEQMDGWMESWREGRQMRTINLVTIADWKQPGVGAEGLWRGVWTALSGRSPEKSSQERFFQCIINGASGRLCQEKRLGHRRICRKVQMNIF